MSTEDDMWQDYDYYMHTGELSEYFEEDDCVEEYESNNTESLNLEDLDDIIRHLKQLKKENERIIREEKKKEKRKSSEKISSSKKQNKQNKHLIYKTEKIQQVTHKQQQHFDWHLNHFCRFMDSGFNYLFINRENSLFNLTHK